MSHGTRTLVLLSLLCAAAVGLAGALLLRVVRRGPLLLSILVAALAPVAAVVLAVVVAVRAMFLSHHDSRVVLVTLACSAVLAVVLSVVLGRRVMSGTRDLGIRLRSLATAYDESAPPANPAGPTGPARTAPSELAGLAADLERTRVRLEESRERERALEASRRELVAFMSHDLRTPLAGLRALAEGLEDGVIEDVPAALARMRVTVERLTALVDDLFELSRLTAGTPARRLMSVSVTELVDDVATLVADHARSRDVEVVVEAPAEDRLRVTGDSDELSRALTNLVFNGVRHTEPGGTVRLVAGRGPGGTVRVSVDDGCGGIAEDDLPRLFEVGWRGAPDRTPEDGGAGLGLAIAQGVVRAHEGTIEVANVPGGCRFEVALPATG